MELVCVRIPWEESEARVLGKENYDANELHALCAGRDLAVFPKLP